MVMVAPKVTPGPMFEASGVWLTNWELSGAATTVNVKSGVVSPNGVPALSICHCIVYVPGMAGAVQSLLKVTCPLGRTLTTDEGIGILLPPQVVLLFGLTDIIE